MSAVAERRGWQQLAATCLLGWHLCSLDAPTVAVVWAMMLARLAGPQLGLAEVLVLGLGTWIVYVLDRVLDGTAGPDGETHLRDRHYFHRRHRRVMLGLCCLAAAWLMVLCRWMPLRLIVFYLALAVPVMVYGVRVHWGPLGSTQPARPIGQRRKEAAVALLFTAAVAAPAFMGAPVGSRLALLVISCLLAWLCWLNCGVISFAEAGFLVYGRAGRKEWLQLTRCALALAFAAAAVIGWEVGLSSGARCFPAAVGVLISCLLLLTLLVGCRNGRMGARRARVLADVGLLTPLLFLIGRS